ncbi:Zn-ribbon domain-containing OB-fold protein [Acidiferrimicrobium sp. IK]|uniref:Zn-ribbon domain-containing OB-fold protein n=1 Tax=Acidiferrimicrobium sp. IK TaxID=2871700 RepID=UPI0021CB75B3|nr:OB-fold domain-containing protein [Acidiferrimicrobium sp. IK]
MTEPRASESTLEFPYMRTTGPVIGPFLRALAQRKILGVRDRQGRVVVPPVEYDPQTGEALGEEMVEVGPEGTVEAWTWVAEPLEKHPLDRPFAFALVRPDGADTAMVHAVDAGDVAVMTTGMRVAARFSEEPAGRITDLAAWEPVRS